MIKKYLNIVGKLISEILQSVLTVFITLKLCGIIDWSWIYVLAPILTPLFIALICLIIYLIITKSKIKKNYGRKY
jgi:hypothetical protein